MPKKTENGVPYSMNTISDEQLNGIEDALGVDNSIPSKIIKHLIQAIRKERAWSKVAREALSDVQSHQENMSQLVPGSVNPNIKRIVEFALKKREEIFEKEDQ